MFACAQLLCFTPNCNLLIWSSVNTKISMTSSASSASWRGGSAQMPPSLISCWQKTEGQWIDNSVGWQVKQRGGSFLSSLPFHWYRISLVKFCSSMSVSFLRWESRVCKGCFWFQKDEKSDYQLIPCVVCILLVALLVPWNAPFVNFQWIVKHRGGIISKAIIYTVNMIQYKRLYALHNFHFFKAWAICRLTCTE